MTNCEKYEEWKAAFKKNMEKRLNEIFFRRVATTEVKILHADKWNVEFQIYGMKHYINSIKEAVETSIDKNTLTVINYKDSIVSKDLCWLTLKLASKKQEELEIKLAYLKMFF